MRLRIDLAYDGSDFAGWAKQPNLASVQATLERALTTVLRLDAARTIVAGRTDAGVHATGQVVHVDVPDGVMPERLANKLNSLLRKSGVLIHRVVEAPKGFDARFSPTFRRYEYRISDGNTARDPRSRRFTMWVDEKLDLDAMNAAATSLIGLHDWTTFCKPRAGATTVRELQRFAWHRESDGTLVAEIQADAFCHNMVRNLVGVCLAVGRGTITADDAVALRDARVRTSKFPVLPPQGLTLVEVGYPPADEVAGRAELTRARRDSV